MAGSPPRRELSPERILPRYLEEVEVSLHRSSHPEVTHFTQTGALDVKAGKLVCHNVGNDQ